MTELHFIGRNYERRKQIDNIAHASQTGGASLKGVAQPSPSLLEVAFDFLRHSYDGEHFSVTQRDLQIFARFVAFGAIERDAA